MPIPRSTGPSSDERLRICQLVPVFPQLSEVYLAYGLAALAGGSATKLVSLYHPSDAVDHPVLQQIDVEQVHYAQDCRRSPAMYARLLSLFLAHGLRVDSVVATRQLGVRMTVECLRQAAQCLTALGNFRPQVMHAHFLGMGQLANIIARELNIPYTVMVHGSDVCREDRYAPVDQALSEAQAIACCSTYIKQVLQERFGIESERITLVPQGVDTELFTLKSAAQPGRLLAVGRLHSVKGFDLLIDACQQLVRRRCQFELHIVGEGPQRLRLQQQISDLELGGHVQLLGARSHAQLPALISQAQLLVMPSRNEGFGVAAIEAMACQRPVVATQVGGLSEVVTEEVGYPCAPEDAAALAERIAEALSDHQQRQIKAKRARQKVLDCYTWPQHAQCLLDMWKRTLPGTPAATPSPSLV